MGARLGGPTVTGEAVAAAKQVLLEQLDCNCYDCEDKFSADLAKYVHSLYRHPPTADVWDRYREFWLSAAPEVIE